MKKSQLLSAACAYLAILSFNASAVLVNKDWHSAGDNLITRDEATGLNWLDLTETNDLSFSYVLTQLDSGGLFDGFRYATSAEVVVLWSNFGIDLSAGPAESSTPGFFDPGVTTASNWLGNIYCEYDCLIYPQGVVGIADSLPWTTTVVRMGTAYSIASPTSMVGTTHYFKQYNHEYPGTPAVSLGHYLVSDLVFSEVPLPPSLYLLPFGLVAFGLLGKKKAT